MKNKFMLIVVVVALLGVGWATFPAFAQDANGNGNGHGNGNQSHADADAGDANETDERAQERQDRAEARQEAHQERQEARSERRAALNESIQLHRDCIRAAVLEKREAHEDANTTDGNTTDEGGNDTAREDRSQRSEAVRECNQQFREEVREINSAARERYQMAKERMQEQYAARLDLAREQRGHNAECRQDDTCADRRVTKWEERKERAEDLLLRVQADLNMTQNELAALEASGNATDEKIFQLEDKAASLSARLTQVERMIERIDEKIDDWRDAGNETD